jgi:VWFA-related protein
MGMTTSAGCKNKLSRVARLIWGAMAALAVAHQPDAPGGGLVIRSTTALVQVRVVAEDSSGRPVTDLQQGDFQIQDDRRPQPIAVFVADRGAGPIASANSAAAKQGPLPKESGAGYALVVLDWLNTAYADQIRAQDAAVKLLGSFQPGQKIAVFILSHDYSGLLVDFTDDAAILGQIVAGAELDSTDLNQPTALSRFDARYGGAQAARNVEFELLMWHRKILDSIETLSGIADRFARLPGRKSLVWISDGFPVSAGPKGSEASYRQDFEKLIERLNRADVGVYTIEAQGLAVQAHAYRGTLQEVAERTGGTAFNDRNDLDEGIRAALEDQRVGYSLAYRLPDRHTAGVHEIRVQVKRRGITLRYRESYELIDPVR